MDKNHLQEEAYKMIMFYGTEYKNGNMSELHFSDVTWQTLGRLMLALDNKKTNAFCDIEECEICRIHS